MGGGGGHEAAGDQGVAQQAEAHPAGWATAGAVHISDPTACMANPHPHSPEARWCSSATHPTCPTHTRDSTCCTAPTRRARRGWCSCPPHPPTPSPSPPVVWHPLVAPVVDGPVGNQLHRCVPQGHPRPAGHEGVGHALGAMGLLRGVRGGGPLITSSAPWAFCGGGVGRSGGGVGWVGGHEGVGHALRAVGLLRGVRGGGVGWGGGFLRGMELVGCGVGGGGPGCCATSGCFRFGIWLALQFGYGALPGIRLYGAANGLC